MSTILDDLKYTKEHEWVRIEEEVGTVGITDFAQSELGDIVFVELPEVGAAVTAGEPFGTIEAVKAVAELFAPLTGTITEVNSRLADEAGLVNSDCYTDGWMVRIKLSDSSEESTLMTSDEYGAMLESS